MMTNKNKNKWFKFNDTTVEEFEMSEDNLMKECFGGTYKVKKSQGFGPDLPEDRQRCAQILRQRYYFKFFRTRG